MIWRRNVRRIYLWRFLTSLYFSSGVLVPFYIQWGGLTLNQVFGLQAWFMVATVVLEVPTGAFADRWGRRTSMICATLCLMAAVAYYVTHRGFVHFLIAELLWAGAASFSSGADEALAYESLLAQSESRASKPAFARLSTAQIFSVAIAAPMGSLIAAAWGLRAPLILTLIPFTLALPVAVSLREPPREREESHRYWKVLTRGMATFMKSRPLRALAFDDISVWCFCFMMVWLYQPRLVELGVPYRWFGFVTAGMTLLQSAILLNIMKIERFFGGPRRYLILSAVISGAALLGLAFTRSPWGAMSLCIFTAGFGLSSRSALIDNYMQKHVASSQRATVLSAVSMVRQLTTAALYPFVGWAAGKSLSLTFAGLGLAVLVCSTASTIEESHLLD